MQGRTDVTIVGHDQGGYRSRLGIEAPFVDEPLDAALNDLLLQRPVEVLGFPMRYSETLHRLPVSRSRRGD